MLKGYYKVCQWKPLFTTIFREAGALKLSVAQVLEIEPVTSLGIDDCLSPCVLRRRCRELAKIHITQAEIIKCDPYLIVIPPGPQRSYV